LEGRGGERRGGGKFMGFEVSDSLLSPSRSLGLRLLRR
jgi:hypothetical protein